MSRPIIFAMLDSLFNVDTRTDRDKRADKRAATRNQGRYIKAGPLLTPTEARFAKVLLRCLPECIGVCPKVRLGDVVIVDPEMEWKERQRFTNFVWQKHLDFVLCEDDAFEVKGVIELDDPSHNRRDRQLRDELVNTVLADVGIPILHIKTARHYDEIDLRTEIERLTNSPEQ
jgi:hypothetical protein